MTIDHAQRANYDAGVTALSQAKHEFDFEQWREQVDKYKAQITAYSNARRWWHKFVPFTITIRRREP